jgi:hypothetical protein
MLTYGRSALERSKNDILQMEKLLMSVRAWSKVDVCCHMLTYTAICRRMLPYADVCCRMLPYADVCCRMQG